jgi:hypothetical protein
MFSHTVPSNRYDAGNIENTSYNKFSIVACAYFGRCLEMGLHVTIQRIESSLESYIITDISRISIQATRDMKQEFRREADALS